MTTETRFKFTKARLKEIEPTDKVTTYHDTEVKGLKLVVSKAGTKTFYVYRKINGRPERIKLGNFPQTSSEQAKDQAKIVNGEIARGQNRNQAKRALRGEWSLDELFKHYSEHFEKLGKRSIEAEKQCYERHLHHLGKRKLSTISKANIKDLHKKISIKTPVQANRVLSLVQGMFNKAINHFEEFEGNNPATGIAKNKEVARQRFLQTDELERFFEAVAQEQNAVIRDYILMSLLTGARQTNVLAMRWSEVDFTRAEWTSQRLKTVTH